jgi:asparaginyl-tRNA synthetase
MITKVIKTVKKDCKNELKTLERTLTMPKTPFKQIKYDDAYKQYGKDFEAMISKTHKEPIWIIDIPLKNREFYDREDPENPEHLRDMDLIYPEGYGEALSGGEREHIYERILLRMKKKNINISNFDEYLKIAKKGLYPSAGFGLGVERFIRFICGLKKIEETTLFPKIPGKACL